MYLHTIEIDGTVHEFGSAIPAMNVCTLQEISGGRIPKSISGSRTAAKELKMSCIIYNRDGDGDLVSSMNLHFEETTEIKSPIPIVVIGGKSIVWMVKRC